jgi:hypothetical protein
MLAREPGAHHTATCYRPCSQLSPSCLQVVDLGELGPVRCGRCKAYMNPYMRWTDGGKTYVCNFCGQANPCPDVYFNYLGPDNR